MAVNVKIDSVKNSVDNKTVKKLPLTSTNLNRAIGSWD